MKEVIDVYIWGAKLEIWHSGGGLGLPLSLPGYRVLVLPSSRPVYASDSLAV